MPTVAAAPTSRTTVVRSLRAALTSLLCARANPECISSGLRLSLTSLAFAFLIASGVPVGQAQAGDEWVTLTAGSGLGAWRAPTGEWQQVGEAFANPRRPRLLATRPGEGVLVNGPTGRTSNLLSRQEFGDVELHVEFMVPKGSNSGVYLQGRYEVQVLDSWGVEKPRFSDCGGIYQRWADGQGFEGHPPRVNASRPPGEWQSFDIVFLAPRFDKDGNKTANAHFVRVVHNDQVIHEHVEVTGPTRAATYDDERSLGPLMLQGDHGPVAYRNIRIRPIRKD